MVDPNAPQGLPPGVPPGPGGPPGMDPMAGGPPGGAPPNPTTDPNALAAIIAAILAEGQQAFEGQQQAALGQAVSTLLQQAPNTAGLAATTMPGAPTPPPMPGGPGPGQGGAMDDPSLSPAGV